jgi:hypothetical protein
VGLLIGALCTEVTRDGAIIIEPDPLHFLIEPTANWDVEVRDLPVIEDVACGWLIECRLVVEDSLFQAVEPIFVPLCRYGGVGLAIGNGLKQPVSDASEEDGIQIQLSLKGHLDGAGR